MLKLGVKGRAQAVVELLRMEELDLEQDGLMSWFFFLHVDFSIMTGKRGMRMKILICEALGHSYGEHRALDACSLALEQGKLHVLLGPSGCGKSTLLEVIAGPAAMYAGKDHPAGRGDPASRPPQQRRLSMVFQTPGLLSAYEACWKTSWFASPTQDAHARRKVQEIAGMLKIGHLLERSAVNLSGGEKQRTAIARALMKEADLILMGRAVQRARRAAGQGAGGKSCAVCSAAFR